MREGEEGGDAELRKEHQKAGERGGRNGGERASLGRVTEKSRGMDCEERREEGWAVCGKAGWRAETLPEPSLSLIPHHLERRRGRARPRGSVSATSPPPSGALSLTLEGHGLHGEHEGVIVAVQSLLPDHCHDSARRQDLHHRLLAAAAVDPGGRRKVDRVSGKGTRLCSQPAVCSQTSRAPSLVQGADWRPSKGQASISGEKGQEDAQPCRALHH